MFIRTNLVASSPVPSLSSPTTLPIALSFPLSALFYLHKILEATNVVPTISFPPSHILETTLEITSSLNILSEKTLNIRVQSISPNVFDPPAHLIPLPLLTLSEGKKGRATAYYIRQPHL